MESLFMDKRGKYIKFTYNDYSVNVNQKDLFKALREKTKLTVGNKYIFHFNFMNEEEVTIYAWVKHDLPIYLGLASFSDFTGKLREVLINSSRSPVELSLSVSD